MKLKENNFSCVRLEKKIWNPLKLKYTIFLSTMRNIYNLWNIKKRKKERLIHMVTPLFLLNTLKAVALDYKRWTSYAHCKTLNTRRWHGRTGHRGRLISTSYKLSSHIIISLGYIIVDNVERNGLAASLILFVFELFYYTSWYFKHSHRSFFLLTRPCVI